MKKTLSVLLSSVLLAGAIGTVALDKADAKTKSKTTQKPKEERVIPYPKGYNLTEGAAGYALQGNHKNSPYFSTVDYYKAKSSKSRVMLEKFKTYQQTKEYSCGPASALMVLNHYNVKKYDELQIAKMMKTHVDIDGDNTVEKGVANERGEWGTSTDRMVSFFKQIGWNVKSSLDSKKEDGTTFASPVEFKKFVQSNLKQKTPVMVEWSDWGAHWQVVIGYDDMGTPAFTGDDVLILADPYDTSDHNQDGYYTFNAERFFYMWHDDRVLPESQSDQQWIVAKPGK
ncbi:C39 family peptidase [Bacillus sp. 1P06AnD]|uniref:C39 family peptidase n=1 Tax=Bacillus sp. 1P06AnD TaxID=3132208 RepID=UPI0039A10013